MISREDEIIAEANIEYPVKFDCHLKGYDTYKNKAFIDGAKWADENPKNYWMAFREKPPTDMHQPIIVHIPTAPEVTDKYFITTMDEILDYDKNVTAEICEWMPVPQAKRFETNYGASHACGCKEVITTGISCDCEVYTTGETICECKEQTGYTKYWDEQEEYFKKRN